MFVRQKPISTHSLPELRSARLVLRPLRLSDVDLVYLAIDRSRDEFERWFTWAHDTTRASVRQSVQEAHLSMVAGTEWHFGIFARNPVDNGDGGVLRIGDQEFCGRIGLSEIDQVTRSAELGYWLDTAHHGHGLMTEAVRLLLSLVLSQAHHLRLNAYTDVDNVASQRVLMKCGFRKVGNVVNAVNHPQRGWRDQYHFSLIADGR